jgi:hypothetical protein
MLAPQRTWFVKQLLDDGHDPAFIARKAGVSVAAVKAIAVGEHRHLSTAVPLGPTSRYRCPECGAALDERTFCLACRLAEFGLEAPDVCTDGEGNAGPGFDLRGEERRRWLRLHNARVQAGRVVVDLLGPSDSDEWGDDDDD